MTKLWTSTKKFIHHCWDSVIGPINPNNEKFNIRTRFKLALLSFIILTVVFLISFKQAVDTTDVERTELFLNFSQHISYVLGAVVASYVGMESVFPSIGGYGWRGRDWGGHHHHRRKSEPGEPAVGPDQGDEDVQ